MLSLIYIVVAFLAVVSQALHWPFIITAGLFILAGYVLCIRDNPEILDK